MRVYLLTILLIGTALMTINSCRKKKDVMPDGEVLLPRDVAITDAEYSKVKDILVYVSTNPSQLNILTPSRNSTDKIPLDFSPMSVSISSDGNFAVVGFDAHLSYVDLSAKKVINTLNVSCEALDIVLGNNKWAYVFPKRDQWENIHCLDLTTGKETLSLGSSIYAGSKGKLHPAGNFMYVTDNNLGPSDIAKFNVREGVASSMYDSRYHGDYPVEGDLWFSEDGKRVFLKGQTVMRLSDDQEQDMVYNGTIGLDTINNTVDNMKRILSLDHSAAANRLYLLPTVIDYNSSPQSRTLPYVYVYDATNLTYLRKIAVKKNTSDLSAIEPHYVFVNAKGDQLYVITSEKAGDKVNWAIQAL
ncbi:YncE family protein [Dyadobacter sp. CY323]|uniref:YncE family protein n=1 Tax=Dyadobacter sp. CY323 TaxID=2907302 RepID=UPI001F389A1A|nr:hypothetical protein [Dyadobacter sp. CY323]MCE6989262.1 hypothetical protein [Dyadobacter sp. CY323]